MGASYNQFSLVNWLIHSQPVNVTISPRNSFFHLTFQLGGCTDQTVSGALIISMKLNNLTALVMLIHVISLC